MTENTPPVKNPNTPKNWNIRWQIMPTLLLEEERDAERLRKVASFIMPNTEVLDLASGAGTIQCFLPKRVAYTPVDFSEEALKLIDLGGVLAPCTHVPLPEKEYHTVLAMEILEHIDQETDLVHQAMALAYAQCIFTVPNCQKPNNELHYHRRTYTEGSLLDLLRPFTDIECRKTSPYGPFTSIHLFRTTKSIIAQCSLQ